MSKYFTKKLYVFAAFIMVNTFAFAQVTTTSLNGTIKEKSGVTLVGATVKVTHQPTGTVYNSVANADGKFNISNMRVGGPYLIEASYIGYNASSLSDIYLKLGEASSFDINLSQAGTQLTEVVVIGKKDNLLNSKRTGAATNISKDQLEKLPTISRSLQDFTRLTPQANGNSFGGANNRFNNITIDGAVNNDVFGLSTGGTPGGGAGTQPISLDAIQEIQVVLAPYDVSLGNFTGAGVNAITRSGTNKFEGSAYFFGRNQNVSGKNVLTDARVADFTDNQYGFRLGGPIVKNKLFFFVNAELGRRAAPLANNAGEVGAVLNDSLARVIANSTLTRYGYDVGGIGSQDLLRNNNKFFTKLDWNINAKNQLTARYNFIDAFDDNLTRSQTVFNFGNNGFRFNNKQHVGIVELRTKFSEKISNNLILGYSKINDVRNPNGELFPFVAINNIGGISGNSVEFGSQRSSVANSLNQSILEFTDNLKINVGKHLITVGTHNEFFRFSNLFINNVAGRWTFTNLNQYLNQPDNLEPERIQATTSRIPGDTRPAAKFSAAQLGFYAQDEFEVLKGLKITAGLRMDIPVFGDKPLANDSVAKYFPGFKTDRTPSTKPLFSPRFGFNYDVMGDRSIQLRGGTGLFTGRVPFAWLSNQYSNSGLLFSTVDVRGSGPGALVFNPDPNTQSNAGTGSNRAEINLVSEDFKIPQVFRTNLAADFKLPYGIIGTLEGIYSKTINNVIYSDLNMKESTSKILPGLTGGADDRPFFGGAPATTKVSNANFTNVLLLQNTNKGYTYNLTAQLKKDFNFGLSTMVAYTNSEAKSVNDGASSTALSNWEFVQNVNGPNNAGLTTSNFQTRHRVIGNVNYNIAYDKNKMFVTGISIFYAGTSGQRFTYLYNGDLNGDDRFGNDLFFVPKDISQIKLNDIPAVPNVSPIITEVEQWVALNNFIENDPYLSTKRGEYTERNGAITPFQHQFDIRISQDLGGIVKGTKNKIQLTFDIFNVGNLLNKQWGRQYFVNNQATQLVSVSNTTLPTGGYTFRAPTNGLGYQTSALGSAWTGQFGIRYLFN